MNHSMLRERYLTLLRDSITDAYSDMEVNEHGVKVYQDHNLQGRSWPQNTKYGVTMIGHTGLLNTKNIIEEVVRNNIEGVFIETGVWQGGCCIYARAVLDTLGQQDRLVVLADSFEGLPPPDPVNYPADTGDMLHTVDYLKVSKEQVIKNFQKYELFNPNTVKFLVGFYSESLKGPFEFSKISVLRIDSDMYMSVSQCLEGLYDMVSVGGYVICDDYGCIPGAKAATDDFRNKRGITSPLIFIDWSRCYWKKDKM